MIPTIFEFSDDHAEFLFQQKKPTLFLYRSQSDLDSPYSKVFEEAAHTLKGEILFATSGISNPTQKKVAD